MRSLAAKSVTLEDAGVTDEERDFEVAGRVDTVHPCQGHF